MSVAFGSVFVVACLSAVTLVSAAPPPANEVQGEVKSVADGTLAEDHAGHDMAGMSHDGAMAHDMDGMPGMYGPYAMGREASGTSWQPESTPMEGLHSMKNDWMLMLHGFADIVYDHQGGPRGESKVYGPTMLMFMAQRPVGPGTLGLRSMLAADPATVGKSGYPLLLQTGEAANGEPLIDRQHPHDLFMEMAASYSVPLSDKGSLFAYFGLPGEPALGPPTFMHRFSGADIPEAPIGHHWFDSTHITFGVATVGAVWRNVKLEGSTFRGREPDEERWGIETPTFDSYSTRVSWNPTKDWALQASWGHLSAPEELEPGVDVNRSTVSASYNRSSARSSWQTTVAWGHNKRDPGEALDAFVAESTLKMKNVHTMFARLERVKKDELFESGPLVHEAFWVNKATLGFIHDFNREGRLAFGVGALASLHSVPDALEPFYEKHPASFMVFARTKIR